MNKAVRRKTVSLSMIIYELRNVVGNPYVHIFGIGLPVLLGMLIPKAALGNTTDKEYIRLVFTSVYLGIGTVIPMASILMGYAISYAQELEKGIPQRMQLFGIRNSTVICNRVISETIFLIAAFLIYFLAGILFGDLCKPVVSGVIIYAVCILMLAVIFFVLGHAIANLCGGFGRTYCVTMIIYFMFMILSGMMGITYEKLPKAVRVLAKLMPTMYINNDSYKIWTGAEYNYVPLVQAYLFLGAFSVILLLIALKKKERK